jgi:hypothetical protein
MSDFEEHARNQLRTAAATFIAPRHFGVPDLTFDKLTLVEASKGS